jgi:hypothetical protein
MPELADLSLACQFGRCADCPDDGIERWCDCSCHEEPDLEAAEIIRRAGQLPAVPGPLAEKKRDTNDS